MCEDVVASVSRVSAELESWFVKWSLLPYAGSPGDARVHQKLFVRQQAVGRGERLMMYGAGRASEKCEKWGLQALKGKWRTAGKKRRCCKSRVERSTRTRAIRPCVDRESCLKRLRLLIAEERKAISVPQMSQWIANDRGSLRQTCPNLRERAEGGGVFSTGRPSTKTRAGNTAVQRHFV